MSRSVLPNRETFLFIKADIEMLNLKIIGWDPFELTLQNNAKKSLKMDFKGVENQKLFF